MCSNEFHFHKNPKDVFNYYNKTDTIYECETKQVKTDNDKSVTKSIKLIKKLPKICNYNFDDGYGDGDGYGYGSGSGDGDGYGSGYGDGSGYGYGNGYGSGYGDGDGYGYGSGSGDGNGYYDNNKLIFKRSFRKCIQQFYREAG